MLSRFEEENIIAGVQLGKRVKGCIVLVRGLGIQLGVFERVREEAM